MYQITTTKRFVESSWAIHKQRREDSRPIQKQQENYRKVAHLERGKKK